MTSFPNKLAGTITRYWTEVQDGVKYLFIERYVEGKDLPTHFSELFKGA